MVVTNSGTSRQSKKLEKFLTEKLINLFIKTLADYRLPNISAALGLAQLRNIDNIIKEKARIYKRYCDNLKGVKGINIPAVRSWATKYIMGF